MSKKITDNGYDSYLNDDTRDERQDIDNSYYLIGGVYYTVDFLYKDVSFLDFAENEFFNVDFFHKQVAIHVGSEIAHDYFVSTDSEEEYIGAKIGSTVGGIVGGAWGPIGAGVGSFVGTIVGDSLGENWHEVDGIFDDGIQLKDIDSSLNFLAKSAGDVVSTVLYGDEKPPPPVAEVVYEFNAETGEYELNTNRSREHDGGKISHVQGPGDQMTDVVEKLLERYTQGEAQLANRHEMPEIKIGYEGDNQYVTVGGVHIGSINGESIQAAIGEVLGNAVIEGGEPLTNHILYSDEISGSERFAILTDNVIQTTIQYRHNTATQEAIDTRLADREEALDLMDSRDDKGDTYADDKLCFPSTRPFTSFHHCSPC